MHVVRILMAVSILLIAVPVLADDQPVLLKDDARLQAKVTLSLKCEPLSTLADSLSKAAGVSIKVRRDIADQNVTAFAEEIPVFEAMNRVARLFEYGWEGKGDAPDKRTYTLFRSLRRKNEAEDLRQAEWRRRDKLFKDTIEDGIKMVDADPSTLQKEFDKNPAQTANNLMFRETLQDLACFTKQQRDDIWARVASDPQGEIEIPFAELPASLQKRLKDRLDALSSEDPEFPGSNGLEQRKLVISRGGGYGAPKISDMPLRTSLAFFGLTGVGGSAGLGYAGENSRVSRYGLSELQKTGIDTSSYKQPSVDFVEPQSKTKRIEIKFLKPIKDGELAGAHSFAEILEATHGMLGISIFADDYLCAYRNSLSRRTSLPDSVDEALGEIAREFKYECNHKDQAADMRCKTWYTDELYEAPKRLVVRWVSAKKKQERLELNDYLEIVRELDSPQIYGLSGARLDGDTPLTWEVMRMGDHEGRFRLCSKLGSSQMTAAFAQGVPFTSMDRIQQQLFASLLSDEKPKLTEEEISSCAFRLRRESEIASDQKDDQGRPVRSQTDWLVFTYAFGDGNEKDFKMMLGVKRLEEEPKAKGQKPGDQGATTTLVATP